MLCAPPSPVRSEQRRHLLLFQRRHPGRTLLYVAGPRPTTGGTYFVERGSNSLLLTSLNQRIRISTQLPPPLSSSSAPPPIVTAPST
eukprot:33362-Prorocentrum_minimum.AAC.3